MKTKTIYLLRHGETDYNKNGLVQGRGVNASLNEVGQKQAQAAGNHFRSIPIDRFYASSLIRTHETLRPFEIPFTPLDGFDEISWGSQEGVKATAEARNLYKQTILSWREGKLHEAIGGGESPLEVMERQKHAMEIVLQSDAETLLICMHGRAMRILLCWLLRYPLDYMDGFPHQNCGFYALHYTDGYYSIKDFNYHAHLKQFSGD